MPNCPFSFLKYPASCWTVTYKLMNYNLYSTCMSTWFFIYSYKISRYKKMYWIMHFVTKISWEKYSCKKVYYVSKINIWHEAWYFKQKINNNWRRIRNAWGQFRPFSNGWGKLSFASLTNRKRCLFKKKVHNWNGYNFLIDF